jgi:methyl-accepting chemotaxis protein
LKSETQRGIAFVGKEWYVTACEPIRDSGGEVVGMLQVGIKQEAAQGLRQAILGTAVGKTGYVYVIEGQGDKRGTYIISKDGARDGENIWQMQDADGRYVIQSIIEKAVALKPGELATERYRWQNQGEAAPRWKVARLAYYAPWDWVIGVGAYEDEFQEYQVTLQRGQSAMSTTFGAVGLGLAVLGSLVASAVALSATRPIREMARVAESLALGNVQQEVGYRKRDEVGALADAFRRMIAYLQEMANAARGLAQGDLTVKIAAGSEHDELGNAFATMIANLRRQVGQVAESASAVSSASAQLSAAASQAGQATNQIAATMQ